MIASGQLVDRGVIKSASDIPQGMTEPDAIRWLGQKMAESSLLADARPERVLASLEQEFRNTPALSPNDIQKLFDRGAIRSVDEVPKRRMSGPQAIRWLENKN